MTFSIAAWDPEPSPPEWGVAVASKFLAVGSAGPWVSAGAGAIATQALANLSYGPDGLDELAKGTSARDVVDLLTGRDEGSAHRQLGVVDASGGAATFTGSECFDWAGGKPGEVPENCRNDEPPLGEVATRHTAACWYPLSKDDELVEAAHN